jgi:hypothetical protein
VKLTDAWLIVQGDHPGIVPYSAPDGRPASPAEKGSGAVILYLTITCSQM